jgi:GNAT superfamily N-acetyltransferase
MPAPASLFASADLRAIPMTAADVPQLQALFETNPGYFLRINGSPPPADAAQSEFDESPPPHLGFGQRWMLGVRQRDGELVGVINLLSDLCTAGAWHIALFWLVDRLHGRGLAEPLHAALEQHARQNGALWLRLSVIAGNARAERFWQRLGYVELRRRLGVDTGGRLNDARVLLKPLAGLGVDAYLDRVARDRPDSVLP